MLVGLALASFLSAPILQVASIADLQLAVLDARPGTTIQIQPGSYRGGVSFSNIHGSPGKPIVIAGARSNDPPRFSGGGSGLQLSNVSHIELRDLKFEKATGNGLNIDDGGTITKPSHHVVLKRIQVTDLPAGNNDGIKLSGIDDFRVEDCWIARWGGSGIDMVGCHRGVIENCDFSDGGDSGVQAKGGSSDIVVRRSRFMNFGQRGVNLGGSTGAPYFRPALDKMGAEKYEARNLTVEGCTFVRGGAPVAFVGCDGANVRFNTIIDPGRWALRILQESNGPEFIPSRNGRFTDNLIQFTWQNWSAGGVNIGPGTKPETFSFARNWWFSKDRPKFSKPSLPTVEKDPLIGIDPMITVEADGTITYSPASPAKDVGARALPKGG